MIYLWYIHNKIALLNGLLLSIIDMISSPDKITGIGRL